MNILRIYLWKEWRDQRAAILGLVVVLPLLFLAAGLVWHGALLREALRSGVAASAGCLCALLVIGSSLIPGELAHSRLRFLERLPASLSAAFFAKLAFFTVVLGAISVYTTFIAGAILLASQGVLPAGFLDALSERYLLPSIGIALWTFAVSAWVPQGVLALPAALLCIGALCWPIVFFFGASDAIRPLAWEARSFCALCALGAMASSWTSFVHGLRFGATRGRSALLGLATAVACVSPMWVWAAVRWHDTVSIDPKAADFRIDCAWVGSGGRVAFLSAHRSIGKQQSGGFDHALLADLELGSWRSLAGVHTWTRPLDYRWTGAGGAHFPSVELQLFQNDSQEEDGVLDGDGRSAELEGSRRLRFTTLPSQSDLGLDDTHRVSSWRGLGYGLRHREGEHWVASGYYDPSRCRSFGLEELRERGLATDSSVLIRPGAWIVEDPRSRSWITFDPETGARAPLLDISRQDRLGPLLADGRVLLASGGDLWLFHPETGTRQKVLFTDGWRGEIQAVANAAPFDAPLEFVSPCVISVWGRDWNGLARLDLAEHAARRAAGSSSRVRLVHCPDMETAIAVEDDRRLVRLRFDSEDREVLFPRED